MADVEIKGLSELLAKMKQLPKKIEEKCLRASLLPAAQLIRNAAIKNLAGVIKNRSGTLAKAIRLAYNRNESTSGKKVYHVFVSRNVRMMGDVFTTGYRQRKRLQEKGNKGEIGLPAFYWRFIEFHKKGRGATPFMRPAFDSNAGSAAELVKKKLAELIEKEAGK